MSINGSFWRLRNLKHCFVLPVIFVSQLLWAETSTVTVPNQSTTTVKTDQPTTDKKFTGGIKITTVGRSVTDKNLKSNVGWAFVEANADTDYTDWLGFGFGLFGYFGSGAGQNYLSDEGAGSNGVVLDHANIVLKPWKPVSLTAGVIGYQINPLFTTMTPNSSLGAEQKIELATSGEIFKFTLQGDEIVPSVGVTKGLVQEERNPFYLAGSVIGELKVNPLATTFKAARTQFKFGNLPKSEAATALISGNSPDSVAGTTDNLNYVIGFAGSETAGVIETDWTSRLKSTLKALYIKNERGFADTNEGRMGRFELKMTFGNTAVKPSVTVFNVEADTTPAGYTILANRYNNRKGYVAGLSLELIKQKLTFFGNYTKANEIVDSPFLFDREIYNLGVEVNYDIF